MSYWEHSLSVIPSNEAVCAAEEQRCVCIIQDLTSDTNKKHTHTLPISTTTDQLYEIVAKKLKYVKSTFSLTFSRSSYVAKETVTSIIEASTTQTLEQCGFRSINKTYIQVGIKDGKNPTPSHEATIKEDSGDEASTSSTGWSYSNERSSNMAPPPPPAPPVPPKIGQNAQRRNAVSQDASTSFAESISAAASKINGKDFKSVDERGSRLLGLVNQAMTCYLNSLIQTLYMTPEFRNALYEWEYKGTEEEAANTIPFQLQRLFLALQTSDKLSVETTDLTKSFGWDSSEAWQQHDIQELCRVMFDALEQKFKESFAENSNKTDDGAVKSDTENEDGEEKKCASEKKTQEPEIIKLYEGTMKDYVQCEECKNETSRNDTYLDIPITIRPFGSTVTYKSVMEGLKAFVEPEILNETNQYFCEKCSKKCDAKKGLKFTSFPYLLTLQLKRFDFDYSTMHRVKLNDRMYFPQELDLNSFIEQEDEKDSTKESLSDQASDCAAEDQSEIELQIVEEEARSEGSSRDSGNDDDRPSHTGSRRTVAHVSDDISEEGSSVDEGIDIESQSGFNGASGNNGTEDGLGSGGSTPGAIGGVPKNQIWGDLHGTAKPKGKYLYELFSIMIHSGSAVGGHYYAYIKSFDDGLWYSFNDQIVSPISQSDIEKSYGGSGARSTYSSSFSSSTNAYMLMYRQIDSEKNKGFITTEQLPEHIKMLAVQEEEREKELRKRKEKEKSMCNIKVYCRDPALMKKNSLSIIDISYDFHNSLSLEDATTEVYELLKLGEVGVERKNCRLVKYDNFHQSLEQSLDDAEEYQQLPLAKILGTSMMSSYLFELLMETKQSHQRFQVYKPGGVTIKVFPADYSTGCFLDHVIVRLMPEDSIYHLKQVLAKVLHYPLRRIRMAYEKYTTDVQLITAATQTLKDIGFSRTMKIYVDLMNDEECADSLKRNETKNEELLKETRLWTLIDRAANLINVHLILPEDAPTYEVPTSRPQSPVNLESPSSETDSIPPLISISPPFELKTCPEAPPGSVRTTPSSDEGLGGSCDGGSAPKTAEGSQSASPKERAQPVECQGMLSATMMSSSAAQTENSFWEVPEPDHINDRQPYAMLPGVESHLNREDELPASQHLRRNSEEDEGCLTGSPRNFTLSTADFKEELNERLMLAAYDRASPTSSLKCEDGSISESGSQTSGEFELQDQIRHQGDGAADSAGSCSTIDSTGTLCNTATDTPGFKIEDETIPIYSYSQDRDNRAYTTPLPTATKISTLPGLNRVDDGGGYAKFGGENITPPDYYDGRIEKDVNLSTATKAESSNSFCDCAMDYSADSSNTQDNAHSYLCSHCGKMKQSCITKTFFSDATRKSLGDSATIHEDTDGSAPSDSQDPESGEVMDITPLFGEIGAGEPKCIEMTCLNNPNLAAQPNRVSDQSGGDQTTKEKHFYFRIYSVYSNDQKCQVLKARLDKRTTVDGLKRMVCSIVQIPTEDFSIYRVFQNGHETELNCLTETFSLVPDEAKLKVKQQRALRKDEHRCKVFQLDLTDENSGKPSIDWVVKKGLKVEEAKKTISEKIKKELGLAIKPDCIRLRKKCSYNPGRIYLNDDNFEKDTEIFIQMLEKPEQKMGHDQSSIFCRRWNPSTLTVGPFQEMILNMDNNKYYSVGQLEEKLAEISDIDAANIEWAKLRGMFPCATSVLEVHNGLDWRRSDNANVHCSTANINEDGTILLYRDKNELLKELSDSEKSELAKKEETRLAAAKNYSGSRNSTSTIRPYSRKERPLKIYTAGKKKKETTAL